MINLIPELERSNQISLNTLALAALWYLKMEIIQLISNNINGKSFIVCPQQSQITQMYGWRNTTTALK